MRKRQIGRIAKILVSFLLLSSIFMGWLTFESRNLEDAVPSRWLTKTQNIYVDKDISRRYQTAARAAIDNWNSKGVFVFKLVEDKNEANIWITTDETDYEHKFKTEFLKTERRDQVLAIEKSYSQTLLNPLLGYNIKEDSLLLLYADRLESKDPENPEQDLFRYTDLVRVIEHELGHTMGLKHDDDPKSIMHAGYDVKNPYGIKDADIEKLRKLYE